MCHGDFHPHNILCTAHGPIIIDWQTASRGRPAGDAACTLLLIEHAYLPAWSPRYMHALLAVTRSLIHRGYRRGYLRSGLASREEIAQWQEPMGAEIERRIASAAPNADTIVAPGSGSG